MKTGHESDDLIVGLDVPAHVGMHLDDVMTSLRRRTDLEAAFPGTQYVTSHQFVIHSYVLSVTVDEFLGILHLDDVTTSR